MIFLQFFLCIVINQQDPTHRRLHKLSGKGSYLGAF